jgi:hypothetical protein
VWQKILSLMIEINIDFRVILVKIHLIKGLEIFLILLNKRDLLQQELVEYVIQAQQAQTVRILKQNGMIQPIMRVLVLLVILIIKILLWDLILEMDLEACSSAVWMDKKLISIIQNTSNNLWKTINRKKNSYWWNF